MEKGSPVKGCTVQLIPDGGVLSQAMILENSHSAIAWSDFIYKRRENFPLMGPPCAPHAWWMD
eukprot:1145397-Pelagomonas_calceolata.AAC.5